MLQRLARIITALLLASLSACASLPADQTLVLQYRDFGPQAMAYPLIGPNRLPWAPDTPLLVGHEAVQVVIYRGIDLATVKSLYPSDRLRNIDYRYVSYHDALRYLDARIHRNLLIRITQQLENTRDQIVLALQ